MQIVIDSLVFFIAAFIAVSVVRFWGSPQSIRNLLFVALGLLVIAMALTAANHDDVADYAAIASFYLLCAAVVAFIVQSVTGSSGRRR